MLVPSILVVSVVDIGTYHYFDGSHKSLSSVLVKQLIIDLKIQRKCIPAYHRLFYVFPQYDADLSASVIGSC